MDMDTSILERLLALSEDHLRSVIEEDWYSWEKVVREKQDLYRRLDRLIAGSISEADRVIISRIKKLESRTKSELEKKRAETRHDLGMLERGKNALKSYRQVNRNKYGGHFGIKC